MTQRLHDPMTFAGRLAEARATHGYPPAFRDWASHFSASALGLLFPHYAGLPLQGVAAIEGEIERLKTELCRGLRSLPNGPVSPEATAEAFVDTLPAIYDALQEDARALFDSDPAAQGVDEIILAYPGFYATAVYRLAHSLHRLDVPLLPRMMSEDAHGRVGIDIHPAAQIGREFFIDHGTGIVLGGTSVIGDRVKLYQGVTLGALQVHKRLAGVKRHPTIEDDVVVYANATILGDIVIGKGSVVGGNVWLTSGVPPHSVVTNRTTVRPSIEVPDFSI